jgi:hypothetical protein
VHFEQADALHTRVRELIRSGGDFEPLARELAVFQAENSAYGKLCAARGVDPTRDPLRTLPAVPTDAFRLTRVATFPAELDVAVFRTSGTTSGARGQHSMRTLATYHDAAMYGAAQLFGDRRRILAIATDAADSSLARMLAWFVAERGDAQSRFIAPEDLGGAIEALERVDRPVLLLATAFAYVHLIDALQGRSLPLPRGSRAMQTGGFKGRTREVPADVLRQMIAATFDVPRSEVVGEYGMTELTSQLWATPETGSTDETWIYRAPHWLRVVACDPATLAPLPDGARGIARFEDLGNVESAWAVQTADEVIVRGDRVEILGRLAGATPRGCSLAVEELLS